MALETAEREGNLITLEHARDYLQLVTDEHNEMVVRLINSVTRNVERFCGRKLRSRSYSALVHDGSGSQYLSLKQYPVTDLTVVRERSMDAARSTTELDIAGWVVSSAGVLFLPSDGFARGWQNIEVDMTAGFKPGVHDSDLDALELAAARMLQVAMQDWHEKIGRGTTVSVGGESVSFLDKPMPEDVRAMLKPYARML